MITMTMMIIDFNQALKKKKEERWHGKPDQISSVIKVLNLASSFRFLHNF